MIFQARFGATQSNLGIQFYDSTGTLLGSRVTTGISALTEVGSYIVTATPPSGAAGIYWNDTVTLATATEDLRDALALTSSGDPWLTTVPGSYADGTAGAALGRLNNTPADEPIAVIPSPPGDADLCTVYVNTETIDNVKRSGIQITFTLYGRPNKSERVLEVEPVTITTDGDGFASVTLQRTDSIEPAGRYYLVTSARLGWKNKRMELEASTFDLATLIS